MTTMAPGIAKFVQPQAEIGPKPVGGVMKCLAVAVALLGSLLWALPGVAVDADAKLWAALRSGQHVALLRHAIAPGTGDPPQFSLDDCGTQRNLSAEGHDQAARIGERMRANSIQTARVFASQWCRCLDTASLLGLGQVTALPILNSFFQYRERATQQNQALKDWLAQQNLAQPLVLVTHQVNITAISGIYPDSGEIVIMRRAKSGLVSTVGTIKTN